MFAISVDSLDQSKRLIAKIESDGKGSFEFPILSDPGHKVINSYGLVDPRYIGKDTEGIPRPAIYILDKDRKIRWAKIESDYRKRPTTAEIRTALNMVVQELIEN